MELSERISKFLLFLTQWRDVSCLLLMNERVVRVFILQRVYKLLESIFVYCLY